MKIKSDDPVCAYCGYDETVQNEPHQLPVGTVLQGQYLIGRAIGMGGFGITYLGWDQFLDIPVAIKEYFPKQAVMRDTTASLDVISYSGEAGTDFISNKERFMREAKMLAKFADVPEIVQIRNFFMANNTGYIVMEYVNGINLKEYVLAHGGKLSAEETFAIMEPVMLALDQVHKAGLVHRDISPDNIMMLPDGKIKILDFGAGRFVSNADAESPLSKSTLTFHKSGYTPIEQYQTQGSLGPWTDVYALCATIYFCLTGEVPMEAVESFMKDEELNFRGMVPELPERQLKVLLQGTQHRAADRIGSMEELHRRLYGKEEKTEEEQDKSQKTGEKPEKIAVKPVKKEEKKTDSQRGMLIAVIVVLIAIIAVGAVKIGGFGSGNSISAEQHAENLDWTLENGVLTITGEGNMPDYNGLWMEEHQEEYQENRDYAPWADRMDEIERVVLGEGITSIGNNAFADAYNLKDVEWSPNLQRIGWMAFNYTALEKVVLPYTVEVIDHFAFSNCSGLKEVELPYRLGELKAGTFRDCEALESVVIRPYTLVETNQDELGRAYTPFSCEEDGVFVENKNLTISTYQECPANDFAKTYGIDCEYVADGQCGEDVFWNFDGETKTLTLSGTGQTWCFDVPEAELETWREEFPYGWIYGEMPDWHYSYREDIENIVVGEGITHLNSSLFMNLDHLKHADLGNVEMIDYLFQNCESLEEIVLPETLTHVGAAAFEECSSLKKVDILAKDASIFWNAFKGAGDLEEVHFGEYAAPADDNTDLQISKDATLYVYENSGMHKYAQKMGHKVVIVES